MHRRTRILAGLAVLTLGVAGCSQGGSSAEGGNDQSAEAPIEFWTAWTEGADTAVNSEPLIQKFEEETGYTVNQTNFTYDMLREKVITSAAGDNLPDVVWGLPEYVGEFYKMGILTDLTAEWDAWEDRDKVSDAVKNGMMIDGKIIGFPYETTARAYLVHDDILADAGVATPETWEDVLAVGSQVQESTGSHFYGLTGTGVRAPQELIVYLAQKELAVADPVEGGGFRNTWQDDPADLKKASEVFQFYADLLDSGAVNPNTATFGWEETDENFATGLDATFVTGNWLAERESTNPESMGDISVHPVPYPADGVPATYIEAKPLMVMSSSENMEGAKALAQAFTSEEWQQAAFPNRSALNTVFTDDKWSKDFATLLESGITYPPVTLSEITQNMIDSLAMVLQEGASAEETATWLSDAINTSLENSGELGEA